MADEAARVAALLALDVLDSAPQPEFDALVQAAALVCGVPISLVSLVDDHRQWFKANLGLPGVTQTPREVAFCSHAIESNAVLEVNDATLDPRFFDNPLVRGDPRIRFYAGAPLQLSGGECIGTLCVIDLVPRQLDAAQRQVLVKLAAVATRLLETRRSTAQVQRMVQALAHSEARFRSLSESAPLGVYSTDVQGHCTYTNPRWQDIYGLTAAQALGTGWSSTLHPSDRDGVFRCWQQAALLGQDFELEFRIQRPDRTVRHVHSHARAVVSTQGVVLGYVGSVQDITLRQQLQALLDRTGRLAAVGGWEVDLHTQLLTWSKQTRVIHEVDEAYVPQLDSAIDFYAEEARPEVAAAVQAGMAQGQPWDLELPLVTAKGRKIWVRAIGEVEFEDGQPVRLIGAIQDITEQRLRRQELRQEQALRAALQLQVAESERLLRERGEMLDVMAHEIRQPLNNASAALQGAARALTLGGEQPAQPRVASAQRVLGEVLASIDNTLAVAALLARPEAIERTDTDLDMLIKVVLAELPAAEQARVKVQRDTRTRTASMDMSLMRLALRNLLNNALRYSPPGSPVVLRMADSDDPLALLLDVQNPCSGIAAGFVPRLFERRSHQGLQRGSTARGMGMGLGLYIVRRVLELHGGSAQLLTNGPSAVTMRLVLNQPTD